MPEPVDDGAGQAAISLFGDNGRQLLEAHCSVCVRPHSAQLRKDKLRGGFDAGRFIALEQLQRRVRINVSQTIGIGQFPVIDKAVMARGAFQVHSQENL